MFTCIYIYTVYGELLLYFLTSALVLDTFVIRKTESNTEILQSCLESVANMSRGNVAFQSIIKSKVCAYSNELVSIVIIFYAD